ncbi:degenerin-like protein unc-105 [Mizuhopecten yessoensis]|uniref:Amiloride-sensitive sodium channel subunit alpha n=1 Tax=Mizuhopecten yessoensis TaxID=6573 RepID=A0A210QKS3_MIZYE|nr:degenerin-like protein unc-105 [Mizuhopecten yessoensis]OWF49348.1 Amiloride-sensitive sodium channel subunit alpha [Mizuhopecten yessoensis]
MDEDSNSWQHRCERYFTSISESDERRGGGGGGGYNRIQEGPNMEWKHLNGLANDAKKRSSGFSRAKRWMRQLDIHGCGRVGYASIFESVIWIVISVLAFGALTYAVYLYAMIYLQTSQFKTLSYTIPPFSSSSPNITICNNNILRKSALQRSQNRFQGLLNVSAKTNKILQQRQQTLTAKELLERTTLYDNLTDLLKNSELASLYSELEEEYLPYSYMSSPDDYGSLYLWGLREGVEILREVVTPTKSELLTYGHQKVQLIVHCWADGKNCNKNRYFHEHQDPDLGNCVTFSNPGNNIETVSFLLNAEPDESVGELTASVGVNVYVGETDSGQNTLTLAQPGTAAFINVQKKSRIDRSKDCSSQEQYSQKACLRQCVDDKIATFCQCQRSYDVIATEQCRVDVKFENVCARTIQKLYSLGKLTCGCLPKCDQSLYSVEASSSEWPSTGNIGYIEQFLHQQGRNSSPHFIRSSLTKVTVNYRDMVAETVTESSLTLLDLFAKIGGISAILVGVSAISILEVLWFVVRLVSHGCRQMIRRSKQRDTIHRLAESDVTSITWQAYRHKRREEVKNNNTALTKQAVRRNSSRQSRQSLPTITEENKHRKLANGHLENNLYSHPLERTGHRRVYNNLVKAERTPGSEFPVFNSLNEFHRPRCSTPDNSDHLNSRLLQMDGGNAHHYPHQGRIVTPADAIQRYGHSASKYICSEGIYL